MIRRMVEVVEMGMTMMPSRLRIYKPGIQDGFRSLRNFTSVGSCLDGRTSCLTDTAFLLPLRCQSTESLKAPINGVEEEASISSLILLDDYYYYKYK